MYFSSFSLARGLYLQPVVSAIILSTRRYTMSAQPTQPSAATLAAPRPPFPSSSVSSSYLSHLDLLNTTILFTTASWGSPDDWEPLPDTPWGSCMQIPPQLELEGGHRGACSAALLAVFLLLCV